MAIKDKVVNIVLSAKDKASGAFGKLFGNLKRTSDESGKADTALGKVSRRLKAMKPAAKTSLNAVKKLGLGISALVATAGASIATLSLFSKSQARLADELTNTKNAIGVSTEALQIWQIAGDRVGVSGEQVTKILRDVTRNLGQLSATGSGRAARVFESLNLDIEEFRRLSPDEQLQTLAESIGQLNSKSEQVGLLETLGRGASQLQPLLENNAAALKAIGEEAKAAGAIYSDEEIDRLLKANDVYNSIDVKLQGLTRRIGAELAPAVGEATDAVLKLFGQGAKGEGFTRLFRNLADGVREFAENVVENQNSIAEGFQSLIDTAQFLGNSFLGVFRGLQTAAAGILTVVAGQITMALTLMAKVSQGLSAIGVVSEETYTTLQAKADAAAATTADLAKQTVDYGKAALQSGANAVNAFDNTRRSAEKAGQAAAGATEEVIETTEDLRSSAEILADTFERMVGTGGDASKAIKQLFEDFDASDTSSVRTLVEAIGLISEKSVEAGQAIEKELSDRLDRMTGAELKQFSETLKAAFDDGSEAASRFGQIAEEVADAALRNIGTSFEELRTGISAAEREALDSFQAFTDSGARSVEDVRKVIGELQDDISSPAAVDALRGLLKTWAQQSGVSIDQVEAQLEELAQNVKGTAAQVASELATAIESAGDQDALDGIKDQIREVWDEGAIGQERYAGLMDMVRERQQALAEESEESGDRIKESMDEAADAADRLGDSTEGAADKAGKAGEIVLSTGNFLALFFNNTTQRLLNLGEKVHDAFVKAMGMEAPARELDGLRERIESLNTEIARIRHVVPGVNVFTGWLQEVSIKSKAAERDFLLQKLAVAELLEEFERGDYSAGILNRSVDELEKRFDLLSDQDLGPLRSAIERIQGEVDSLNTSLTDTIASLRQELAGLRGDTVELEGLRYQEKRAELEERLQRARELGDQETIAAAQQALNLQEEAYRLRLADAKAQEDAERERVAREAAEEERRQQEAERQQRQRDDTEFAREERQSRQSVEAVRTITVNLGNDSFRVLEEDEGSLLDALEDLGHRSTA